MHVVGKSVRIDEIGIIGGKAESAVTEIPPAASDFQIVLDVLLFLQFQQAPIEGTMQPAKYPMRSSVPIHLDQNLVLLLGNSLHLMQHDDAENRHALVEH